MRARRVSLFGMVVLLVGLATTSAFAQTGRTAVEDEVAAAIVQFINAERQARSLAPLARAADETYAQQRAVEQPDGGNDGHAGFSSDEAAAALGLGAVRAGGETLFYGSAHTAGDAVVGWMESDSHRDLLMNSSMTLVAIGVSCRDGEMHAVAHAGAPVRGTPPRTPSRPVVSTSSGPTCEGSSPSTSPSTSPSDVQPTPVTIPLGPVSAPGVGLPGAAGDDEPGGGNALAKTALVLGLAALVGWIVWGRVMRVLRPDGGVGDEPGGVDDTE